MSIKKNPKPGSPRYVNGLSPVLQLAKVSQNNFDIVMAFQSKKRKKSDSTGNSFTLILVM